MGRDDDEEDEFYETLDEKVNDEVVTADLSHLHAMDGKRTWKSLMLSRSMESTAVTVLVDTDSSHDFLHPRVAERLHLPITAIKPFRVYVGNGASIVCSYMCKRTKLVVQGTSFIIDLHVLPIHGLDVVLGMDWLESFGRVTTDFVTKSMEFVRGNNLVVLHRIAHPPSRIYLSSLADIMSSASLFELYEFVPLGASKPI